MKQLHFVFQLILVSENYSDLFFSFHCVENSVELENITFIIVTKWVTL